MVLPLTSLIWKRNTAQIICRPRLPGSRHLTFTGQSNTSKKYFPVPNQKLITMERLAGFTRHELLSGKECITLYTEFMHEKFFHNPESLEKKRKDCSFIMKMI